MKPFKRGAPVVGLVVVLISVVGLPACQSELDTTRTPDPYSSFGDVIYREACQRVAYLGQLEQKAAGQIDRVDVSGGLGRAVCVAGEAPPDGAPPRLFAIVAQHPEVATTVDTILPQPFLATLETFLENLLPAYDDGTMEAAIGGLGQLMAKLHDDPAVATGLARLGARHGYRAAELHPGVLHALVEYPGLDDFVGNVVGLIGPGGAAHDEWRALLAAGGVTLATAEAEADPAAPERTLRLALDLMFSRHADLVAGAAQPVVVRDVRGVAKVAGDGAGGVVAPFVDSDRDGLADLDAHGQFVDAQGRALAVPTPFLDPEALSAGRADPTPRDVLGRAVTQVGSNDTLYQYLDLDGTLLIGAVREAPNLLNADKDTALGLLWGASGLLGPRTMQTRTYRGASGAELGQLTYNGFDLTQSPALDLLHAFVQVLGAPAVDHVLQATATLLTTYESETARAIAGILDAFDRGKLHLEASIPTTSTVHDELAPIVARTLRVPGLAQDLITALQDPHVRGVAPMIARMMRLDNQLDFNHTNQMVGAARGAPFFDLVDSVDPPSLVDRAKPDADYNRSIMQRIAHLIHDANGAQFCNKAGAAAFGTTFARCKLFEIDDLSLFFALNLASDSVRMDASRRATTYNKASFREQLADSIKPLVADSAVGDGALQGLVGINGFVRFPTPKALSRALFLRLDDSGASDFLKNTTEPVQCRDGDRFIDVHDKSIFAWELALPGNPSGFDNDTFFDAVRPLIDAFAKHDECVATDGTGACTKSQNAVKIFVDLMSMLHEHWASPSSSYAGHTYQAADRTKPRFASPDNVVSYEPLIAEVLDGDLPNAVLDLAPVLDTFTVDGAPGGTRALPIMIDAMRYVFDPQVAPVGLAYRDGATEAVMSDGRPAGRATPFTLLADGFFDKRAKLAAMATTADGALQASKWKAAASELVDLIFTVDHSGAAYQFHNRRFHAMTQILIDFVRGRIAAHATAGDLEAWVHHDLTQDLTDKLAGPVFAALGDLTGKIERDPGARAQMYALLNYVVDEVGHNDVFRTGLTTLADQAQSFLDDQSMVPILRVFGAAMDPQSGIVDAQIALVKRTHELDTDKALLTILRNLFRPNAFGVHPASDLADVISAIDRSIPGPTTDLSAADEASVLAALRDFFSDNQRGFLRFVGIVRNRDPEKSKP